MENKGVAVGRIHGGLVYLHFMHEAGIHIMSCYSTIFADS